MPSRQLTGSRVRSVRLDRGIKQAELAQTVGISSSYLNLIEHNRRRIGGKILNDLARALGVDPGILAEGAEDALINSLRQAADAAPAAKAELPRTEQFAGRFPGWAALIAAQSQQIEALKGRVAALTDRLAHDPALASSLHDVISAVTSIRSTSSILVSDEDVDRDWQRRFHRNIYDDSQRLAESSRALIGYLDAPGQEGITTLSPADEVEAFWQAKGYHLPEVEAQGAGAFASLTGAPGLTSDAARTLLKRQLHRYAEDAHALPLPRFFGAAQDCDYDPGALAVEFAAPIGRVLRRLATLPHVEAMPAFGLAICDGAGAITYSRPDSGFAMPRAAPACPLWPLFHSLSQPGQPLRRRVDLPGDPARSFLCYAIAEPTGPASFDSQPTYNAVMLVRPMSGPLHAEAATKVGNGCRICPREACPARREPSVLAGFTG